LKNDPKHITDDLLVKYLLAEADEAEQQLVHQWLEADAANRKYFEHFRFIWEESKQLAARSTVNEEAAWERFKQRRSQPAVVTMQQPRRSYAWLRVAAILLLVAGGAWLYLAHNNSRPEIRVAQSGEHTLTDTLPDGSVVVLNKHSSLSYPVRFKGDTRTVELSGEAFFTVVPAPGQPFLIQVDGATVKVLGTSFNIKQRQEETEVIVETGAVELAVKEQKIRLHAQEKAVLSRKHPEPVKQRNNDKLYNYYRTREFVCNGTPLWKLAAALSEAYDVTIETEGRVRNLPLTTTFPDQPLDSTLNIIRQTFNLTIYRNGKQIILK
jgi:ferric-dicitrate binding protein FerR (iron transport regulator)